MNRWVWRWRGLTAGMLVVFCMGMAYLLYGRDAHIKGKSINGQAVLPWELVESVHKASDMPIGGVGFTKWWHVDFGLDRKVWLDKDAIVKPGFSRGYPIRVERTSDGYVLDMSDCYLCRGEQRLIDVSVLNKLPVVRVDGWRK